MLNRRHIVSLVVLLLAALLGSVSALPAASADGGQNDVVGAVPAAWTPWINDGQVYAVTQVGNTMLVGGSFTSVSAAGGSPTFSRTHIVAFDATTGAVSTAFNPQLNGNVQALLPGPTSSTVYVAGNFTQVNGQTTYRVVLLDLTTGQALPSFKAAQVDAAVNTMRISNSRLFIGGYFDKVNNKPHYGLATLNPNTGALDPFMNIQLAGHHNTTGSGDQTSVGARALDISADGSRMIVIGNFTTADGLSRQQVVMVNLTGASAAVETDWNTTRYTPLCFSWAFDSDVRAVQFSPDGQWFVITATGGHNNGTLCDTASRFETFATGTDIQPSWIEDAGGDTLWGLAVTSDVVYVGGHQRWLNDSAGSDFAGEGAVPRPGLGALDPNNGVPLAWNPGRNPRGAGAYCLYVSPSGLWVGSDTQWIGNMQYKRPRIAYFPLAQGYQLPSVQTPSLPGSVYVGGAVGAGASNVLYRIDAAGPSLQSLDGGPDWAADQTDPSPYRNSGSNIATYGAVPNIDSTVPASTPPAIFSAERWDPNNPPEMSWTFPVPAGEKIDVRLYFANRYTGTSHVGDRVFNVELDGTTVLPNFDIVAAAGDQTGTMRDFNITSDGTVNIDFTHVRENPLINGIEIVRTDVPPPPPGALNTIQFDGTNASAPVSADPGDIDWSTVRGAFILGSTLFYGKSDGFMYERSFTGGSFGPATKIDPYDDPTWDGVSNGSGGTYDGTKVDLYGQLPNVTGLAFSNGRLYYTLFGDSNLYYRYFTPDSGIVGSALFTASGSMNWSDTAGMFFDGGTLYFAKRSTGALWKVSFAGGAPSGTPVDVNDPSSGGDSWAARALFIGPTPPPNQPPVAQASATCPDLSCTFDGSGSTDPDGTITSYSWSFGDGNQGSGAVVHHAYTLPGTYNYTLTVTDNDGAQNQTGGSVTVTDPGTSPIQFGGAAGAVSGSKSPTVVVPSGTQAGDLLLLTASMNSGTITMSDPTGVTGWTSLGTANAGTAMVSQVWWKIAAPGDAGSTMTVPLSAAAKTALQVLDYGHVNQSQPIDTFANAVDTTSQAAHTTPTINATSGDWVVSLWSDKSSATTAWTAPGSVSTRDTEIGTGTGYISALAADSGGGVGSAPYGGLTASTNQAAPKATMWTIALAPQ